VKTTELRIALRHPADGTYLNAHGYWREGVENAFLFDSLSEVAKRSETHAPARPVFVNIITTTEIRRSVVEPDMKLSVVEGGKTE
jgi:hypothetical protein